jgi:citrate lyase subunit beta/citryl-CoA lyase
MLEKARGIAADEVVIDLEDAVAITEKVAARKAVLAALSAGDWRAATVSVRINGSETDWFGDDLVSLAGSVRLDSIVIPKVESVTEMRRAEWLLDGLPDGPTGRPQVGLQALIETGAGLAAAADIAAAGRRLESLVIGYADLAASLGRSARFAREPALWLAAQDIVLIAARAAGLQAIDGPWLETSATPAFEASAAWAAELGFDGKWAIHPSQVDPLTAAFTPDSAEIADARRLIAAMEEAERAGAGAAALDGEMIDRALVLGARRLLARAGEES